jgi:integrase
VPQSSIALLKRWKVFQAKQRLKVGDLWAGGDWVFTTWDGHRMHPDSISGWWPKFLKKNNLPHIPFHGLRHTSATLLIAEGTDVQEVAGRLGHATTSTTTSIYSHFIRSADQAAAEKLDNLLTRRKSRQDGKQISGR